MSYKDLFANPNDALLSPSGNYCASVEEFDNAGTRSYYLHITELTGDSGMYRTDIVFRARDRNIVCWADSEDILWAYSGDIGTFFWIREENGWGKNSYAHNKNYDVPSILKEARPKHYK